MRLGLLDYGVFDFPALWPMEALRCLGEGKISRWLEHRFPSSPA